MASDYTLDGEELTSFRGLLVVAIESSPSIEEWEDLGNGAAECAFATPDAEAQLPRWMVQRVWLSFDANLADIHWLTWASSRMNEEATLLVASIGGIDELYELQMAIRAHGVGLRLNLEQLYCVRAGSPPHVDFVPINWRQVEFLAEENGEPLPLTWNHVGALKWPMR